MSLVLEHPILILVRGLPGSGKSYLTEALCQKIGADQVVVLDPDSINLEGDAYKALSEKLSAEGVDTKFHPYRYSRAQAYAGIESNKAVIWNQAFTNLDAFNKTIANLQSYATDHNTELPLLVVEVEVDPEVAKARIAERSAGGGHDVPEENFARFLNDYRSFVSEGYNTVIVNGQDNADQSVATIMAELEKL